MSLSEKQREFSVATIHLLSYLHSLGYEFTWGDAYRDDRCNYGHPDSTHRSRLAIDINLFVAGEYISDSEHPAWIKLHDYFELLGGSPIIKNDARHFSFSHNGVR